ncbi:sugar phosphate isomerase/epimerase family protein [Halobaculum marinum]|uniref:Sugar phosphate isomerase/epimerase family protein n=1 Tax=Halobaculum marinum TaxID=3031996 RepID=A0ABD5X4S8_9EURY|nr:sugar phosphate isomerase/epimerase [Halobaculum sp. DT55]
MSLRQGFTVETGHDLDAALSFAADSGFDYVELNMDAAFERSHVDAGDVRAAFADAPVDPLVHLPYRVDPGSVHAGVREGACRELEASIDTALEFGAERGVMHATSRANAAKFDGPEIRDRIFESVRRVDEYASDRGFSLVVENVKGPFFDAGDFPALFAETDAAACLDTGHAMVAGYDLAWQAALLREHGDRIDHVHLNTRRGESRADEHLPIGIGGHPFDDLAAAMRETDWSGTCTHEVFGFDYEYVALGKRRFDEWLAAE